MKKLPVTIQVNNQTIRDLVKLCESYHHMGISGTTDSQPLLPKEMPSIALEIRRILLRESFEEQGFKVTKQYPDGSKSWGKSGVTVMYLEKTKGDNK